MMARLNSHSVGEKIIGWGIGALCFLSVAYFAWYRLPVLLWYWASEVWWHWIPAFFAYFLMFIVPIFTLMGAGSSLDINPIKPESRFVPGTVFILGSQPEISFIFTFRHSGEESGSHSREGFEYWMLNPFLLLITIMW